MSRSINKPALSAALAGGLLLSASAFGATPLAQGYMLGAEAAKATDAKAAEAKCGADMSKGAEGSCGADKKPAEGNCGADKKAAEGSCGADKAKPDGTKTADGKAVEGKCGEGKCGSKG